MSRHILTPRDYVNCYLTSAEWARSIAGGHARFNDSRARGLPLNKAGWEFKADTQEGREKEALATDCRGFGAELAVSRITGLPMNKATGTFHGADLGTDVQVRCTPHPQGRLLIRPKNLNGTPRDPEGFKWVSVIGELPLFLIIGWVYWAPGFDELRPEWRERKDQTSFYVPNYYLRPIRDLIVPGTPPINLNRCPRCRP